MHLALKLSGVKPGDYVICPSLTFVASANVIMYEKAIPVFIDVDEHTWTMDTELLEKSIKRFKPKAVISVDLYGQSADYDEITQICDKYKVNLIEDAAEALGANYKNKKCGTFGNFGIFSFNGNKIITTGGGGMLISENEDIIKKARFLSTQAREPVLHYEHRDLGYNYRMSNLLAALGRGQLSVLDERVNARREIADRYDKSFKNIDGINLSKEADYGVSTRWLSVAIIDSKIFGKNINEIIKIFDNENIEARPVWKPMHLQPLYSTCEYITKNNQDISNKLFETGICLPSGSALSIKDQDRIINLLVDSK